MNVDDSVPSPLLEDHQWTKGSSEHNVPDSDDTINISDCEDAPDLTNVTRESSTREPGPTAQHLLPGDFDGKSRDSRSHRTNARALPKRRRAHLFKNWWAEIGACIIFVIALLAIVLTVRPHQNKPLPQWPYHISVNSLISIYVVILKAAVLLVTAEGLGQLKWRWFRDDRSLEDIVKYDSATRGPLGAFSLLWQLGLQHPLSSFWALITIVMLAIDPFAQQIIRYYGCNVPVPGQQATIPRTNVYTYVFGSPGSFGGHVGAGAVSIPPEIQTAINAGIFSPGGLVTPSCLTGNCSFSQPYSTIGFCGGCTDVTSDLRFNTSSNGSPSDNTPPEESIISYLPSGTFINSNGTLPTEFIGTSGGNAIYNVATMNVSSNIDFIVAKNPIWLNPTNEGQSDESKEACQSGNNTWQCLGYGAASCTINPCVRTYSASVSVGDFQETWISDTDGDIFQSEYEFFGSQDSLAEWQAIVDTQCLDTSERTSLAAIGYSIDLNSRWLPYNLTFDPVIKSNPSFPSSMLEHECLYAIDNVLIDSLRGQYLSYFFNGTITGVQDENGLINRFNGPQNLQTIYNYGNITFDRVNSTFHNISNTLTTYVRQAGLSNHSIPAMGVVMHDETCLQVRWGWLALPAIMVLATILFFAAMVIETRPTGNRAQIWKSSPLAFIFHGLQQPNLLHENHALEEVSDMERIARGIKVRLTATDEGVHLVPVEEQGIEGKEMEDRS